MSDRLRGAAQAALEFMDDLAQNNWRVPIASVSEPLRAALAETKAEPPVWTRQKVDEINALAEKIAPFRPRPLADPEQPKAEPIASKLAPVQPTPDMLAAGRACMAYESCGPAEVWAAMLHAAPEQPKAEPLAYLYHDAARADAADPLMHSTLLVIARDRRPNYRNETPLCEQRKPLTQVAIDALLHASREAEEGPTALIRRVERAHGIGGAA